VIPADSIFFFDDLDSNSDICTDESGKCFQRIISKRFAPQFKFSISQKEFHHLRQLMFPKVMIDLPERNSEKGYIKRIERLRLLDHNQEAIARKFDGGHRIISGPSGSGKSLVLVHKAAFLKQYNPDIHNILFVCYNITLVNYIKRLLSEKKAPLGDAGVTVCHFYELCAGIIGEDVAYEKEDADYYDTVLLETGSRLEEYDKQYDAILVDEGQDFTRDMLKIITGLLNPETNNLTIALDDNQNIYRKKGHWKDAGVQAKGRVHKIPAVYRNTVEIAEFADRFIQQDKKEKAAIKEGQPELFPGYSDFHGPKPEIKQFKDFEEITAYVADQAAKIVETENCPYSEIAVLYALQNPGKALKTPLPRLFENALGSRGMISNWVSENYHSKRSYDISTDSITISTIHSVKGLDYSVVFLLGLDFLEPKGWTEEQLTRLAYVAITRARYQLFIPYLNQSSLISKLQDVL
jgi:superfamily I DNA/RNA helicase